MNAEFTTIGFPAVGGPEDGKSIDAKGMLTEHGVMWPAGMWTPNGFCYVLEFDENRQPTQWRHDSTRDRT